MSNIVKRNTLAQARGQVMETLLKRSADKENWHVIKIPMGARMVGGNRMVRVRTPFDYIFSKQGNIITPQAKPAVIFCDAKTVKDAKAFSHSMITEHQIDELVSLHKRGFIAGYVVNFTQLNVTVFFTALRLYLMNPRQSLSPADGILMGNNMHMSLDALIVTEQL